jgi:hypothetical protein
MNTRFATKKIPAELMLSILNLDPSKLNISKIPASKRPKRGYTVCKSIKKEG